MQVFYAMPGIVQHGIVNPVPRDAQTATSNQAPPVEGGGGPRRDRYHSLAGLPLSKNDESVIT
ncbi:hypothetical protein E4U53_001830 [Claviceps sorghi]|nr:hypothetical protein E4U53_001830 [Claviceps sorghi]